MIDLSFLTEEEQETILAVLKRDASLKRAEEQRVQRLQKSPIKRDQLRYLSGEWFYETKQLRHEDRIHGSDLIRASMKQTYKPLTIFELSQVLPPRPSFLGSENKGVFVPPVLSGLLLQPKSEGNQDQDRHETHQDVSKSALQSPTKQRQNPFDIMVTRTHTFQEKNCQSSTRDGSQTQTEGPLGSPSLSILFTQDRDRKLVLSDQPVAQDAPAFLSTATTSLLTPTNGGLTFSTQDSAAGVEGSGGSQTDPAAPCGILKHPSATGPTDHDWTSMISTSSSPETWTDRKQVRFSPEVTRKRTKLQSGKELGEHSVLDVDTITTSLMDNSDAKGISTITKDSLFHGQGPLGAHNVDDLTTSLVDNNRTQENSTITTDNPFHCQSPLDAQDVGTITPPLADNNREQERSTVATDNPFHSQSPLIAQDAVTPSLVDSNCGLENSNASNNPFLSQGPLSACEVELTSKKEVMLEEQETTLLQINEDISGQCYSKFQKPPMSGFESTEKDPHDHFHKLELEPKEDRHSHVQATDFSQNHTPEQRPSISSVANSDKKLSTKCNSKSLSDSISLTLKQKLFGISRKGDEIQFQKREEVATSQQEDQCHTIYQSDADKSLDKTVSEKENAASSTPEVRTLQLVALQKTPFKEAMIGEDVGMDHQVPEKVFNLRAFWEKQGTASQINDGTNQSSFTNVGTFLSKDPTSVCDVEMITNTSSDSQKLTAEDSVDASHIDFSLSDPVSKEDGTYRAKPVIIYEDTDESLTGSITETQFTSCELRENIICSGSSLLQTVAQGEVAAPNPFSSEDYSPVKVSQCDENAMSSLTMSLRVNGDNPSCEMSSAETDQRASSDSTENSVVERQMSPSKAKLYTMLKTSRRSSKGFASPERSPLKSPNVAQQAQLIHSQSSTNTELQEQPVSPRKSAIPRPREQGEEVRRSPSKTCHPKALPRETSGTKASSLEGSPLKTFQINIEPQIKTADEEHVKSAPVPRQRRSPSHEVPEKNHADTKLNTDFCSSDSPSNQEDKGDCFGLNSLRSSTSPHSKRALPTSPTRLARSYVPQDYEHYLGPHEKAYIPPFYTEKRNTAESDIGHGTPTNISTISYAGQHRDKTRVCSASRASLSSHEDNSSPTAVTLASSKSLDNLLSDTTSVQATDLTSLTSKQMKTSVSVPHLQLDETDSDSTFEANLSCRRNTGSSMSNISISSGMASMSSVSGSTGSIYHAYMNDVEVQGSIQFAVNYIQKLGEFHIFVVQCNNLAVADNKKNRSDPYVKCYLLPDQTKMGKKKTAVRKKTLNPTYNEILRFKVVMEVLKTQTLNVSVWHNDTFGRNAFLGKVDLDLSAWDFSNTQINEYALKARSSMQSPAWPVSQAMDSRGQMRVALRFLPQTSHSKTTSRMETGEVQIWVKDCKNLPPVRGLIIDPFVKCAVLPDTSRKSRQKTRVVKRTANPMFNHTMVYDGFRPEDLKEACVEITVWDHDRLNNHYIGGLRLGLGTGKSYGVEAIWMDSTREEAHLWQRMFQSDGEWVEDVLPLRMFVMSKGMSK